MYIVDTVYSDNSADILETTTCNTQFMTEKELITFGKDNDVLGLSVSKRKLFDLKPYDYIRFTSYDDAYQFANDNHINTSNIEYSDITGYFEICVPSHRYVDVGYYILHYTEIEQVYVSDKNGYCNFPEFAKVFDKKSAQTKAAMMNRKHGFKYWITQRVIL